jgi:hypothetical protein
MAYKNSEGYNDPTAGEAMGEVAKEERLNVTDSDTKNADKSRKER